MIKFISSKIPRMYDVSLPNFVPLQEGKYEGAKVRLHVKIPAGQVNYDLLLEAKRKKAEELYQGATILIVPDFEEEARAETIPVNASDLDKIQAYVEQTVPEPLQEELSALVTYLEYVLRRASVGGRFGKNNQTQGVKFNRVDGKDILGFERVSFSFAQDGIRLVLGKNLDNGGSNGSGKSGLLQLIRIALYGSTTKGQQHDALVRRHADGTATSFVRLLLTDRENRRIECFRSRRPVSLKLSIDGRDFSSGNSQKRTGVSTQELVERSAGLTQDMFDHSVIIDQKLLHLADSFLSGTDKEKKELLDAFLGTERFLQAGKKIRESLIRCSAESENIQTLVRHTQDLKQVVEDQLNSAVRDSQQVRNELLKEIQTRKELLKKLNYQKGEVATLSKELAIVVRKNEHTWNEATGIDAQVAENHVLCAQIEKKISNLVKRKSGETCETCGQVITEKHVKGCLQDLQKQLLPLKQQSVRLREKQSVSWNAREALRIREYELRQKLQIAESKRNKHNQLCTEIQLFQKRDSQIKDVGVIKLQKKIRCFDYLLKLYSQAVTACAHRKNFLTYCESVFSRTGLVNFLYEQLCTPLNKAAKYYSEIFTNGVIQLRFSPQTTRKSGDVVNEFNVEVINSQGGENLIDQSRGEEQLAALMCVLCLREIGPQTNLLILDEPTEGLDVINARRFAQGLIQLQKKFPVILIATHNSNIIASFKESDAVTVIKEKGVSRIEGAL